MLNSVLVCLRFEVLFPHEEFDNSLISFVAAAVTLF